MADNHSQYDTYGVRRHFARAGSALGLTDGDPLTPAVSATLSTDKGALTDRSGTLSVANTTQQIAGSNTARKYIFVQNPIAASETLLVDFDGNAAAGSSFELAPGGFVEFSTPDFVPTGAVHVNAATQGHVFIGKEG